MVLKKMYTQKYDTIKHIKDKIPDTTKLATKASLKC